MKKGLIIITTLMCCLLLAVGCGKKDEELSQLPDTSTSVSQSAPDSSVPESTPESIPESTPESKSEDTLKKDENGNAMNKFTLKFKDANGKDVDMEFSEDKAVKEGHMTLKDVSATVSGKEITFYAKKGTSVSFFTRTKGSNLEFSEKTTPNIVIDVDKAAASEIVFEYTINTETNKIDKQDRVSEKLLEPKDTAYIEPKA